jgi:hypothetical protein
MGENVVSPILSLMDPLTVRITASEILTMALVHFVIVNRKKIVFTRQLKAIMAIWMMLAILNVGDLMIEKR